MPLPPVNIKDLKDFPPAFKEWLRQLQAYVSSASGGLIPWANVSKSGSNLNELTTRDHNDLTNKQGGTSGEFYHTTAAQNTLIGTLAAGTYTPTLTAVANLDAQTAYECQYLRVGATVTVSGRVDVDPTLTATSTQLGISLPIASNLGAVEDCAGTAFASGIVSQGAAILGDAANNRAQMQWISGDVTNQAMYFTFTYQVI